MPSKILIFRAKIILECLNPSFLFTLVLTVRGFAYQVANGLWPKSFTSCERRTWGVTKWGHESNAEHSLSTINFSHE